MSIYPDRDSSQRKEQVLQRCPFLATFLNSTYEKLNPTKWENDLEEHYYKLSDRMTERLGSNWQQLALMPLVISANNLNVFNPIASEAETYLIIRNAVAAGFEVGDKADIQLVFVDLVERLGEKRCFNPHYVKDPSGRLIVTDYLIALVETGVYLSKLPPIKGEEATPTPKPSPDSSSAIQLLKGLNLDLENL